MSACDDLEKHIGELETLVSMIRFDVMNLKSGNKHASVDARKRLSTVSKLAQSLRSDCLSVAKGESKSDVPDTTTPKSPEAEPLTSTEPDTQINLPHLVEITEQALPVEVLKPEEKSILHTIAIDNLKREVEQSKHTEVSQTSLQQLVSKNPRSRKPKLSRKKK
jgi:hypothetical protein